MANTQKSRIFGNIARHLENSGGPILAFVALLAFIVYLVYAHFYPNAVVVKTLQVHGSAAQVVSVAVVLFVAFTMWGVEKMLFKIAEREQLRNRNAEQASRIAEQASRITELEARVARIPILERLNAELEARLAELENQRRPQNEEERQ